ncbi:hypothetical protein KK083_20800 [Fulvivirgaceae bacterium PWU4]|uniref:Uncharacterized protein n=1 Tax=Chryseosolibacter histidini TaxID=2782349 RepID=A0AAP2DN25_9BACT|nr:hypothetical protein [Chryseosolibacter histidini]MBT1699348.1 hypothetical protein [Chryseosolibacter histidini]
MRIILNNRGLKTLQSFRSWQTNNEQETMIEFEPIFLKINNCLHINSIHVCADGKRKKSNFIHVLTLGDIVILRDFLTEVLNTAEHELQINSRHDNVTPKD